MGQSCIDDVASCPNPSAGAITFHLVNEHLHGTATIQVRGEIWNSGMGAFESEWDNQEIFLSEDGVVVATAPFGSLAPCGRASVSYVRSWDRQTEFYPTYRTQIVYDADLALDDNPGNDDCVSVDNSTEVSGSAINALFN